MNNIIETTTLHAFFKIKFVSIYVLIKKRNIIYAGGNY